MDDFPFLLNLNYKMNDFEIKPPNSLSHLKEIATEKYDLKIAEMFYVTEDGEEKELENEEDYLELIQYATDKDLKQVEIVIKKNENTSQKRKESLRKKSSMKNENENFGKKKSKLSKIKDEIEYEEDDENNNNDEDDDDYEDDNRNGGGKKEIGGEMGMQCEYDYFGDTRNRKGLNEEGYTKQNKGYKEDKRIYYIKDRRKRQREEDLKKNKVEDSDEDEKVVKNRKRIKKEINEDDEDYGNNASEVGKKSNKKKKKPKKDRVRF